MAKLMLTLLPDGLKIKFGDPDRALPVIATDVISYWLYGPDDSIVGIELQITSGESHVSLATEGLAYIELDLPYMRIWFGDQHSSQRGAIDDWQGTIYQDRHHNALSLTVAIETLREADLRRLKNLVH